MNMRQPYVIADGVYATGIKRDVRRQVDCYNGHPGPVLLDVTAILEHPDLDGIVEDAKQYSSSKGLEMKTYIQVSILARNKYFKLRRCENGLQPVRSVPP
jgi:hypothetical protein